MDAGACRRAAIESLSENLTDGYEPVVLVRHRGAAGSAAVQAGEHDGFDGRLQDAPVSAFRLVWRQARRRDDLRPCTTDVAALAAAAAALGCSGRKALAVGLTQHAVLPGPNAGWSEAAAAGALERRLVGPIWLGGRLVTETQLAKLTTRAESHDDVVRAMTLVGATGVIAATASPRRSDRSQVTRLKSQIVVSCDL